MVLLSLHHVEFEGNRDLRGGYDVVVACQLPKLNVRVQFPLPAPALHSRLGLHGPDETSLYRY